MRQLLDRMGPLVALLLFSGCSSTSGTAAPGIDAAAVTPDGGSAGGQTPPMGGSSVEAWLKTGTYKSWHCEPAVHASRSPSPHGFNRICSNDAIAASANAMDPWPQGAAAVKELFASATDTSPVGYAVYLKTSSDSAGGGNWYWYERVPLDNAAPHDTGGVVANGSGDAGAASAICVGCHVAAGSDTAHTPSAGGRDLVYTPVH